MKRPRVVFLVNGEQGSAMGIRARSFASRLSGDFDIRIGYRSRNKIQAIGSFLRLLASVRPEICYILDMGFSGVLAARAYRLASSCRLVVDTGDAIYELSRGSGTRSRLGLLATKVLESMALSMSHRVVVRSHPHQELLREQGIEAAVIPDGVDTRQFRFMRDDDLRRQYNLQGFTTIGVLGSLVWNARWQMCYGWDLVEAIDQLCDLPLKAVVIGDGPGLAQLNERCVAGGIQDRVVFLGRIPYDDLPRYLSLMDICLSTQTNDLPGRVRTTGKLPLYLACGRFVLASSVGEAARVLPPEMLLEYNGTKDIAYPSRLASRVRWLLQDPKRFEQQAVSVRIAQENFEYNVLAATLRETLLALLSRRVDLSERAALVTTASQHDQHL